MAFDLVILSIARQCFNNMHSEDFHTNTSLLSQINKTESTPASLANKLRITLSIKVI